jgi:hypothetical protein
MNNAPQISSSTIAKRPAISAAPSQIEIAPSKPLTLSQLHAFSGIVNKSVSAKGQDFYKWRDSPEKNSNVDEIFSTFEAKLNGAYGERCVLSIAFATMAAKAGKKVALLQKQDEPGLPFNAEGWLVLGIEGHPLFHIAPWDLSMAAVKDADLVTLCPKGSTLDQEWTWKGTDKVQELSMLSDWAINNHVAPHQTNATPPDTSLTPSQLEAFSEIVKKNVSAKGQDFYKWRDSPEKNSNVDEIFSTFEAKLNGAYGERCVLAIAFATMAAKAGKKVALLQKQDEPGLPFNAEGWLVLGIEGHPIFHLAPWDVPMNEVGAAGLVTLCPKGSALDQEWAWKGTDKVQELSKLLDWALDV